MSIVTFETRLTHRYLMAKSKSELAYFALEQADIIDKLQRTCWRCGGSGQRSYAETLGSPGDHPCPACKPAPADAANAPMAEPGPVEYAKVKRAMDQISSAVKRHSLVLVVDPEGNYDVVPYAP